jgi:hypothetical protein
MTNLLAFSAIISSSAFAADPVAIKMAEQQGQTPFQVLKNLFDSSASGISLSDVDLNTAPKKALQCSGAKPDDKDPQIWNLLRYTYVLPGKAPQGPLFPGTPDEARTIVVLFQGDADRFDSEVVNNDKSNSVKLTIAPLEITEDLSSFYDLNALVLRKNGKALTFKAVNNDKDKTTYLYGYCYPM